MIDVKIPAGVRDSVPVIACGSDVLWVVGYRISENYKVTKETKRVIRITVLKED
jgi:tRNA(Ile)-lysidine synthase